MIIAFRVDASLLIGSGHIMRCLTLADALKKQGASCHFFCRKNIGDLHEMVVERGHQIHILPDMAGHSTVGDKGVLLAHASWLPCSQQIDAMQTMQVMDTLMPEWLIVDNYALDHRWESQIYDKTRQLLVIDDLADRQHECDLLLDQNLGRTAQDYTTLVPVACRILAGPAFALLGPEFSDLREASLVRRQQPALRHLLVTLGGADHNGATSKVLNALRQCTLPPTTKITVVMGAQSQSLSLIHEISASLPWNVQVMANIKDMARVMVDSDLAIGAAGSTSWERCCLGLPALQIVLASNQLAAAKALTDAHAVLPLVMDVDFEKQLYTYMQAIHDAPGVLVEISKAAAIITDGQGCKRVIAAMQEQMS